MLRFANARFLVLTVSSIFLCLFRADFDISVSLVLVAVFCECLLNFTINRSNNCECSCYWSYSRASRVPPCSMSIVTQQMDACQRVGLVAFESHSIGSYVLEFFYV
ncbi:hypothetical protein Goarm_008344 [Gossypium armourianum]|uniref:Uncharacterized protein n=1 Tax=Gossypium armourianum TaxID=34283 RepID=A0A7J9JPN0_9ROSI|nr:hypothetical protein [Gossypium armourianum]